MAATQLAVLVEMLESIPHPPERPRPQGILATKRWTGFLLDLLIHPTQWHKLGFAVQWAKWIEWEGGLDLKDPTLVRSPGILYLQNPLHPFALNNLLNQLDFSLIDVETLIGCVETGDWSCLLQENTENTVDPTLRTQATQSLEHLCLLSFYLQHGIRMISTAAADTITSTIAIATAGANGDAGKKEQRDYQLVQDLVARILSSGKDSAATPATITPKNPIWHQAFSEQALRLTAQQSPRNPQAPSTLSVLVNELLEMIRLTKIRQDGWEDAAASDKLSDAQFQQLGRLLSTSFFTIIEFADVSLYLPIENIIFLSKFAAQLPASWYSDDFLKATIRMAKRYIAVEQVDKVRIPIQVQGLVAITTLWSFWMRKTGSGADVNVLGQELIEIMIQVLSIPSFFISGIEESKGMFGTCFSGLAMGLDKWSGLMEPKIMDGLVAGLKLGRVSAQDTDMEGIQASLATVLRSNVLNESPEPIKELITAFLQDFYGASSSAAPTLSTAKILSVSSVVSNIDELFQVLRLFQFVVTHKAGLVTVKDDEGDKDKKRKKKKSKPKKAVQLKGVTWFEALIQALQDTSNNATIPSLLAVAGILRAIQHAEDDPPRVDADSLALIQDLFVTSLRVITEELKGTISSPEDNIAISNASVLSSRIQACLVFATSQTIPNLPACKLEALDSSLLADLLLDYVLQQNEQKGVIPITEIFRTIAYEIAQQQQPQPNRLKLNGMTHQLLTTTTKGPLFTEIGRIARTIATLIETMDDWGKIEHLLERMHSFAINIHVDWSRCSLSSYDSFVIEGQQQKSEPRPEPDPETSKSMAMLFQVFKTVLFAYTMIFGSINEKWENATVGLTSQFDFLILDSYAHLFFITYKLGPGSFQVYEELITSILTRMVTSEGIAATLQDTDKDGESSNHHVLLNKTLKRMKPRAELGLYDPVMESRTLFYMNLLERIMIAIEEPFLEHELLPMVYPYLLKNDQRDLFESAHSVIMSVFLTNKTIAKQLAPYYSNLLLQHFPDQINIDQLRAAFTTMIKSLSETEDALAWLCVEKLLEKIQQYDTVIEADIKAQELSQNEQEKAVAALAKEQQERDSEKALVQVATEVYQDLSPQDSATQLPSLNTPTPSPPPLSSAVPPATSSSSYSSSSSVTKTTASIASLELQKERGQILLALFDQLSSLNLVFVQTLGDKIRELLSKEQSPVSRKALLKCILDVVGGPSVDQTKRDWAVKWYLGLVNEFGRGSSSSSLSSSLSTPISMSLHKH